MAQLAASCDSGVIQAEVSEIRENPLNKRIYNKTEDYAFIQSIKNQRIIEPLVLTP